MNLAIAGTLAAFVSIFIQGMKSSGMESKLAPMAAIVLSTVLTILYYIFLLLTGASVPGFEIFFQYVVTIAGSSALGYDAVKVMSQGKK